MSEEDALEEKAEEDDETALALPLTPLPSPFTPPLPPPLPLPLPIPPLLTPPLKLLPFWLVDEDEGLPALSEFEFSDASQNVVFVRAREAGSKAGSKAAVVAEKDEEDDERFASSQTGGGEMKFVDCAAEENVSNTGSKDEKCPTE